MSENDAHEHQRPAVESLTITSTDTRADWLAYQRACALRMQRESGRSRTFVLVLALSSHGEPGSLSVSNNVFALHDLTAGELASALRDSGIEWRVIIISACYAGSFIEPLRNPRAIRHRGLRAGSNLLRLRRRPRPHVLRRSVLSRRTAAGTLAP